VRTWITTGVLAIASLTFFLAGVNNPRQTYYDESQYVSSAQAFLTSAPNPNPEAPPLGKLLIATAMRAFGNNSFSWRATGALFGALTLVGTFLWAYVLLQDYALALTAAMLTLLNNFLFVMSRIAMMDVFLVAFLIWGLLGFTAVLALDDLGTIKRRALLIFSGAMFGFACACKWNGVDTLAIVLVLSGFLWIGPTSANQEIATYQKHLRETGIAWLALSMLVVPVIAYCFTYWPLCRSLHLPFDVSELIAMNLYIWRFHRAVQGNAPIMSAWYSWPLQVAPQRSLSYLVGNWFIMWAGLLALCVCARRFVSRLPETLVILLYAGNLLQWAVTPQRCLYYYYYFPAAMFLGLAIPVALRQFPKRRSGVHVSFMTILPAACVFLFCFAHMAHLGPPFDSALGYWP
jgi:dolichyl-phosphate-mannose--protein O-mannosyl transferase